MWDETVAELQAHGAATLALDVPGCGTKRSRDFAALTTAQIVDELAAEVLAWRDHDVILVGHSQAGTILPLLQARIGVAIARLVYVCCVAPLPGKNLLEQIGSSIRGSNPDEVGRPLDPATTSRDEMYRQMFCNEIDAASAAVFIARLGFDQWPMHSMTFRDWDYTHLLDLPSTYILCERDQALPPEWQEIFAARLHCARTVRIDAGHQVMNAQPAALAQLLLAEA